MYNRKTHFLLSSNSYKYCISNYSRGFSVFLNKPCLMSSLVSKTKTRVYRINTRNMMSSLRSFARNGKNVYFNYNKPIINDTINTIQKPHDRSFCIIGGKVKPLLEKVQPSIKEEEQSCIIQSDLSGAHKQTAFTVCDQKQCHRRLCDTTDFAICPLKQGENCNAVTELGGALTHAIPPGKKGIVLSVEDAKGETKNGPQMIVREKTTPLAANAVFTLGQQYVQQKEIAQKIAQSLPPTSAFHLKNTSLCDTPNDANF